MKKVTVYTDGACRSNPGPGGWGAVLCYKGTEKELHGGEAETTNNRMELLAAINALSALKEPCIVEVWSDSKYLVDAIERGWARKWQKSAWKGGKAKNPDLWEKLLTLLDVHKVSFVWIKGHNGHPENEFCDKTAVAELQKFL